MCVSQQMSWPVTMKQVSVFDIVFLNLSLFVCVAQEMLELYEEI